MSGEWVYAADPLNYDAPHYIFPTGEGHARASDAIARADLFWDAKNPVDPGTGFYVAQIQKVYGPVRAPWKPEPGDVAHGTFLESEDGPLPLTTLAVPTVPKPYVPAPQPPAGPGGPVTWRTLADGRIEIQGEGVPLASGLYEQRLRAVAAKWGELATKHAVRVGVPASHVLAFIDVESAGNPAALSPAGAIGLMQLMKMWWGGRTAAQMTDPETNVTIGTDLLATIEKSTGTGGELPKVASVYNCGADTGANAPRLRPGTRWGMCAEGNYIGDIVNANNSAIALGLVPSPATSSAPFSPTTDEGLFSIVKWLGLAWTVAKWLR